MKKRKKCDSLGQDPNDSSPHVSGLSRLFRACKQVLVSVGAFLCAIPWKRAFSWVEVLPWRAIPSAVWRFTRSRLIPIGCFLLCLGILAFAVFCTISAAVCDKTRDKILTMEELEAVGGEFDCILVLGCRVYSDGRLSAMLEDRVSTAVALYHAGIGAEILMSGDSRSVAYDETGAMCRAALAGGVPEEAIRIDPMGLSTYDSIARLLQVWHGKRVVIVTQEYHLYRALYLAEQLGIEAYGVSADRKAVSAA